MAFQSTRPVRGATSWQRNSVIGFLISIHAPRAGRDSVIPDQTTFVNISIHAPRAGRDRPKLLQQARKKHFNPRAPCGARRTDGATSTESEIISIHAPRAGRDGYCLLYHAARLPFQSTRPVRGATNSTDYPNNHNEFQSTRPVRGATAKVYKITLHTFATKGNS